ncbi:MAG TPA: hypothetical protein PLL10_09025 [Elusimicrobiales bacterium]|nr:hypothetical protein [Elusimicrobiales bacterium]
MRKSNARFLKSQAGQTLVEYLLATLMLTMATAGVFGVLGNAVKGAFQQVADVIASETQ